MSMRRLAKPITCNLAKRIASWPSAWGGPSRTSLLPFEHSSAGTVCAGVRSMPYTDFALSSVSTLLATRPPCHRCGGTMRLVRLVPIPPHAFERTFECPTCEISPAKEANVKRDQVGPLSNSTDGDSSA